MSTARFARSGRARICILMSMFLVLIMMIVIYHMSQQQLDETRAFRLRCEQNQEGLNLQLQSLTDDKLSAEKKLEEMHNEKQHMQAELDKQQESERSLKKKYDEQLGKYKVLDGKHNDLQDEYAKSKKQQMEDKHSLLLQVQQLQQDRKLQDTSNWKNKYEALQRDTQHKIHDLESALSECKMHCTYAPPAQQLNKPSDLQVSDTTPARRSSPAQLAHSIEKPHNEKSFNEQVQVSQGLYKIGVGIAKPNQHSTNATTNPQGGGVEHRKDTQPMQSFDVRNNHSLIINSVENFQIAPKSLQTLSDDTREKQEQSVKSVAPLSAPQRKPSSSTPNVEADSNVSVAPKQLSIISSSSSTGQPPLVMPPAKPSSEVKIERKLPENVAPIPENFDGKVEVAAADADTAAEELPKNENNNRYANVVNDLESNKNLGDSGGHEVKDALNEQNFNFPGANPNIFADGDLAPAHAQQVDNKMLAADAAAVGGDDDDVMLGDVAGKQHILDGDNLNNEIAADQGKEFADAVHLEDNMDEDQDEDDYNVPARKLGADAAVRN
ncbi:M protein, serotype 2.1 isoform X1 [Drosophila sulfurigaster albostrigata]|uniref:M protein, serotype 2.1 isoform X1 n=1 Tax=Drosophila sulfurigaster albostrigata TaxID=89887 RepID=UPI002D21D973|nr:M protein, serotype 2.1 isoform X1 [Drosophila sulfurigaster albostrigata]